MGSAADRPNILVTNDDGYGAPGIAALIEAVAALGRVTVVAPDREQSAAGHALTLSRPLRVDQVGEGRYRVDGTPTDCVHLAVPRLTAGGNPDLVVSGINRGLNVGDDVTYSGTVAAALEGTLLGVPSIAFSLAINRAEPADYTVVIPLVRRIAAETLKRNLPAGTLLNVNFPCGAIRGTRVTRQGTRSYRATAQERHDPTGRPYYWIDSADTQPTGEPDGDHKAIEDGYVSISPLHANMTHEPSLVRLGEWALESP